jgi:hypothetical protein
MVTKPENAHKCSKLYYIHSKPPTCFGHTCEYPRGGALQRIYAQFFETIHKYNILSFKMRGSKYVLKHETGILSVFYI